MYWIPSPRGLGDVTRLENMFWTVDSLPQDVGCRAAVSAVLLEMARASLVASSR